MPLIKQTVKDKYRSNDLTISETDQTALVALMEGVVSVFEKHSSGGTDIVTPASLRPMRFGVSRPADNLSATVHLKHVKPAKHANDVFGHVALFDGDWKTTLSATKIGMIYKGAKK